MSKEIISEINIRLDNIFSFIVERKEEYYFSLNSLPVLNNYETNILKVKEFESLFSELNRKKANCIYWFELENEQLCKLLVEKLFINIENLLSLGRTIPPINKNKNSKILYLGIRRGGYRKSDGLTNISGRMVQHFGYYKVGSTQGLQLAHWCKGLDYKIKLNIVELDGLPDIYLNVVEKILAFHLRPLCGKH